MEDFQKSAYKYKEESKVKDDQFFKRKGMNKPEVLIPKGTEILHLPDSLDIRINWFKAKNKMELGFKTVFTLFWSGALYPFVTTAMANGDYTGLLMISAHLLVALGLLFWVSADFLNTTDIIVEKEAIYLNYGPLKLPFKYEEEIPTKDIKQLYVSRYSNSSSNGKPIYKFGLYAVKTNGKKIRLIDDMDVQTQQYLEQEIERFLNITDIYVSGEWQ